VSAVAHAPDAANPVRNPGQVRRGPVVTIRFTDFAQVTTRFLTLFGPTPEEAMRRVLRDTGLAAHQLRVKAQLLEDVAVLRRMPADAPAALQPGAVMPIAFVDGLNEAQLASALAALAAGAAALN
jgi:2-hydroxychromene-2-carboxylate isomerase